MDSKIILESFLNAVDIGTVFESINNYRKRILASGSRRNHKIYYHRKRIH